MLNSACTKGERAKITRQTRYELKKEGGGGGEKKEKEQGLANDEGEKGKKSPNARGNGLQTFPLTFKHTPIPHTHTHTRHLWRYFSGVLSEKWRFAAR